MGTKSQFTSELGQTSLARFCTRRLDTDSSCFILQENQSNTLHVCPFPCGCVCEMWIMFIHLMDHLSTKTELEV